MHQLNCTLPVILEFPNFLRRKSWWATLICLFLSLYIFVIMAIVCDDYLLPAMERLCYALKLSFDVAAATFLASATSAPELFINFVGTFITEGDIGVGTIVGSSVFNILVIAAVCGILVHPTKIEWWPLSRDLFWYVVAIVSLAGVMWDSVVTWYESLIMLVLYIIYFAQLFLDKYIKKKCFKNLEIMAMEDPMSPDAEDPLTTFRSHVCGVPKKGSNCCAWTWWLFKYPAELILALTIPSARTAYGVTLIMSVIWISMISYFVTWFLTVVGHNLNIPDSIMGFTILASGTSVPEVVSSYVVAKKGRGTMAICNAVGSNTFDIMICLGLPWLLQTLIRSDVIIDSSTLNITTAMLVVTAGVLFIGLLATRFILGKIVGWLSLISYIIFLVIAVTLEMVLRKTQICDIESGGYESYFNSAW